MNFKKNHIDIISLGCSKNLIDSERLLKRVESKGFTASHDPESPCGEYVVVNTCGFIGDAKEESINLILQLSELKKQRYIGKIVVMGCLSERYRKELPEAMPEVDLWYGKFDWKNFLAELPDLEASYNEVKDWDRVITSNPWTAYLRISEGCNRGCAFCAIPKITGPHTSRPMEEILEEAQSLAGRGVKELNLIAQDLSSYGLDLYAKAALPDLLEKLAAIEGIEWIRLHYLYPSDFPMEILPIIRDNPKICKYLDLPLQHISDNVLSNMNRKISGKDTLNLLEEIRKEVPGISIRTTLMVGFPGEDEKSYSELVDFVSDQRFERMGAFAYSEEEGTSGAVRFKDEIPEEVKRRRLENLMNIQEDVSLSRNLERVGKTLKVLIERVEGNNSIGRSEYDSPEVDNEVIIKDVHLEPGSFVDVEITEALPFELIGKLSNN